MIWILQQEVSSMRDEGNFFSVATTTPFLALIPRDVSPLATAARAFQIWGSLPLDANVVSEKSDMFQKLFKQAKIQNFQIVIYMFDQLLGQLQDALSLAKNATAPPKGSCTSAIPTEGPFMDPTKPFGHALSFAKSQRFKEPTQQQLKTSHIQWRKDDQSILKQVKVFSFVKGERFQEQKPKYNQTYINPNINVVKKNITKNVPIYKAPTVKDLGKSNVSISTVASESFRGPGIYNVKDEMRVKNGVFSKDGRFKQQKSKYQDIPLLINQNQTKRRPPSCTVIKPKTKKTKQLITIKQQEQLRQKLKMVYWRNVPLQFDRLFKNNNGPIIRQKYFDLSKLSGTHKRAALFMMLDRLNYLRGGYEQNIHKQLDSACAVVYRRSTPKPFKFSEMDPGPEYYYPNDDYIKPNVPNFSFGRQGIKQKMVDYDDRDYQIKEQIFKKGGNIIINPVHKELRLSEQQISNLQRGPGYYDCLFGQVQKRVDIGVVKFQEITVKNDRSNNCVEIKEVNDGIYFPSYGAIDPNVAAPLYKEPANVQPMHLPDKILFPEHWLFYDRDLNKVRAEIAKNVILAKNMSFKEYKEYKIQFQRFKEYMQLQRITPEVGQYLVDYKGLDPHVANYEFGKQEEKTLLDPITKPEGNSDGDNLILNPKRLEDHLPNIDFKKMEGRQEQYQSDSNPKEGDILILNPSKPQKHIPSVNIQKQESRPEGPSYGDSQSGPEGDVLLINPKPVEPHLPNIDFSKQANRPEIVIEKDDTKDTVIVNPKKQQTIKGVPFSRLSSVRMVPILRQRSKIKKEEEDDS